MKLKFVFDEIEAPNYIGDAHSAASSTTQREDRLIFTAMPLLLPAESSVMASLIAQAAPLRTDPELLIKLQAYNFDHRCREKVVKYINEVRKSGSCAAAPTRATDLGRICAPLCTACASAQLLRLRRMSTCRHVPPDCHDPCTRPPCPNAQLSEDFGLLVQTSSMACNYFDRYILKALRAGPVSPHQMQMIATTCLLISAKFIDRKLPPLSELVKVHNQTATAEQFAALERVIVVALEWNLHVLLPHSFLGPLRATLPGAPFSSLDEQRTHFFMDLSVYGTCSTGRHLQPRRRPQRLCPTP